MEIHLLDVGEEKYGDCILVTKKNQTILIDGAHPGDTDRIAEQLEALLNSKSPFNIDLLIVTHCHRDHIGCLPALVQNDIIKPKWALVADESLGWGKSATKAAPYIALSNYQREMLLLLQEEDHSDLSNEKVKEFLADLKTLREKYVNMLKTLENNGTKVIRYLGHENINLKELVVAFKDFELEILGPSSQHLEKCAEKLKGSDDLLLANFLTETKGIPATGDVVRDYKAIMRSLDRKSLLYEESGNSSSGAAKNNQSIVVKVKDDWSALLAGDMQFALPQVSGLKDNMKELIADLKAKGPYDFVKLTHHTSDNGLNEDIYNTFKTKLYGHTGGVNDPGHPDPEAIEVLKNHQKDLQFARTDHNGLISIKKTNNVVEMIIQKGSPNDFTLNNTAHSKSLSLTNTNASFASNSNEIEIITKIPPSENKITVTINLDRNNLNVD